MKTPQEELLLIATIISQKAIEGFRDIEGTYNSQSSQLQARKNKRLMYVLNSCLHGIIEGGSIQQHYDWMLENATRTNQCEQDRLDTMEELSWITELLIEVTE